MAKKKTESCDTQEVSSGLGGPIGMYSADLQRFIDKGAMKEACMTPVRSMRLHLYHSILRDACRQCFRGTNPVERAGQYSCDVWGFNGRFWEQLQPVVFADAVGAALIACAGLGAVMVTEDWVAKRSQILSDAYSGVCTSPLECSPSVVGFANGVWDFSDVEHPVKVNMRTRPCITSLLPYCFDPKATCPLWVSFLNMMLPRKDVMRLQKYLGLGVVQRRMMGHTVEDTLWLIGSGANGKSTIARVLSAVYGDDRISWLSMRELLDRNPMSRQMTLGRVDGRLFNICEEADMRDITKDSDSFKKLCSGAPQSGRDIGKNVREIKDIPFLIFMMNARPSNKRMDDAFRRRIVEIVFRVSVKEDDMDANLAEKLLSELSGIRNWMIEGYRMLVADGFLFDHSTNEEYQEANEQYFDIFAKHEGLRPSAWAGHGERVQLVSAQALLEQYDEFCQRKMYGRDHQTMKAMAEDLKRLNFHKVRRTAGIFYEVFCERPLDYAIA